MGFSFFAIGSCHECLLMVISVYTSPLAVKDTVEAASHLSSIGIYILWG